MDSIAPTPPGPKPKRLIGGGRQSISGPTLALAARKVLEPFVLGTFLLFLLYAAVVPWHPTSGYAWDFRAFYDAGHHYLHLQSPYGSASLAELTTQRNFVYPLPVAALFAPLSLLPYVLAASLFIAASAVLLCLALWILDIRDWRCYAAVLLGMPVQLGLKLGTLSPLLAFLLAVLWRYRHRTAVAVVALTLLVLSKIFLWPIALWFIFIRRSRVAFAAAAASAVAVLLATLPFGLSVLTHYPGLLRAVSNFEAPFGFSVFSLGAAVGLSGAGPTVLSLAAGGVLLACAFVWGRRGDESAAFRAAVVAALALSPIVWGHYLVLLFVPLALVRPKFAPVWLATAWVWGDGFVLEDKRLLIVPAVLVLMLLQAGLLDVERLRKLLHGARIPQPPRFVAYMALWAALLFVFWTIFNIVPTVAALRAVSAAADSTLSGTAFLRFYKDTDKVCWHVWTKSAPAGSRVVLLATRPRDVRLAGTSLDGRGQSSGCARPAADAASYTSLLKSVKKHPGGYEVDVVAPGRNILLRGGLVRRVDASGPLHSHQH